MSSPVWTLALDESGNFEAEPGREEVLIIGGVLCPGPAEQLASVWEQVLRGACKEVGGDLWPPHAVHLPRESRKRILEALSRELARAGGRWIFVAEPPASRNALRLAIFPRMFGELVDLSARFAGLYGARQLDVRPATRTLSLTDEEAQNVSRRGIAPRLPPYEFGKDISIGAAPKVRVRSVAEVEVRHALDALSREEKGQLPGWPSLNSVQASTAEYGGAHPGVFFADFACNFLHGVLRGGEAMEGAESPLDPDARNPPLIIARGGLRRLRGLDRALREGAPDLWQASQLLESLVGDVRGNAPKLSPFRLAREGTVHIAQLLWDKACLVLGADLNPHKAAAMGWGLSGRVQAALAAKTGDYEGTWRALAAGWAGEVPLARLVRGSLGNRELSARMWRQTLECANHRGDVSMGRRAVASFRREMDVGLSFALLSERQQVDNLEQVMLQNCLPAEEDEVGRLLLELEGSASRLVKTADEDGELIALALRQQLVERSTRELEDAAEEALMAALGHAFGWQAPDLERGRFYGTAARSLAFCGRLEDALALGVKARGFFMDSPRDLRFNAAILSRILLEKARLSEGEHRCPSGLHEALLRAGVEELRKARQSAERIGREANMRFVLDLILRSLLWAPGCVPSEGWTDVLCDQSPKSLFSTLSSGELRSHPTELIARHAGEWLSRQQLHAEARGWFTLSREVCLHSTEGSVLRRLLPFTSWLAEMRADRPQARPGSILNPSFEYR
ncbi:hypothetical protein [Corallococcus caeni]|uniref:DUF3800 domain-containing protein n=1 Tax=Corallococcus caeni TaxID=3082388 RepID=A0ABQ6QR78_9BACT|nr:hypothetical protein ASNO1_27740 [Corallococcus sp. NO1]